MELLEARIAPAAIVTFTEPDGDVVTVKTSKGTTADLEAALFFTPGGMGGLTLDLIDFAPNPVVFSKTDVSVTVTTPVGDGLANVGRINASRDGTPWIALGKVIVQGNLGEIDAGEATGRIPGIKSLTVESMRLAGLSLADTDGDGISSVTNSPSFTVKGDVSEAVLRFSSVGTLLIGGGLVGGDTDFSGRVEISDFKKITIVGAVVGGGGEGAGYVVLTPTSKSKNSTLSLGPVLGGAGEESGVIAISGSIGTLNLARLEGGSGSNSGSFFASRAIKTVTVGSDASPDAIRGGSGAFSGSFDLGLSGLLTGEVGKLTIHGNIVGGTETDSGYLRIGGKAAQVTMTGTIIGSASSNSGYLKVDGDVGKMTLDSVSGGTGHIVVDEFTTPGQVSARIVKSLTINGTITGNTGDYAGVLAFASVGSATLGGVGAGGHLHFGQVGALTVNGDLAGIDGNRALLTSAKGFKSIRVNGDVEFTDILAGPDFFTFFPEGEDEEGDDLPPITEFLIVHPDTQIGPVTINGDWTASNLAAGVNASPDVLLGNFGDADDALPPVLAFDEIPFENNPLIPSAIKSIVIDGTVSGTAGASDHFGFVAQQIGSFKIKGPSPVSFAFAKGPYSPTDILGFPVPSTLDVIAREIGAV